MLMKEYEIKHRIPILCALLFLSLLLLFFLAVRPVGIPPARREIEAVREALSETGRVVHAGGFLWTDSGDLVAYTNSYDALVNMYEQGNRVCEIDIRETADGVLVCAHGDDAHLATGSDLPVTATAQEFADTLIFGEFLPMTVDMLADFMREHPDLYIITDAQGNNLGICRKLAGACPDLRDRFVIQIYHENEYDAVRGMGFQSIIYTLYRSEDTERNLWQVARIAQTHELVGITAQWELFGSLKNRMAMAHSGTPYMFHTVDDLHVMEKMLRKPYVYAVYTDFTGAE